MWGKTSARTGTIYACPVSGYSYCESLYAAARALGIDVREGVWLGRWLFSHLHAGDVLHLHWPSFLYYDQESRWRSTIGLVRFIMTCLLLRLRGVRIWWTAHNLYPHDGGRSVWMHRVARRFVVRVASRIFVHGASVAAIVRDEFGVAPSLLTIVPHGNWIGVYPNTLTRFQARERLGLPQPAHVFLFIGLCKPYKGLDSLIETMSRLETGAVLLIAGKFPTAAYEKRLRDLAQRLGSGRVRVCPGFIDDADMQVFLNAADTVVLPYREILTSGAAMLAMSFGRPVVAPRMGGLVDQIADGCGLLYDHADPDGLLNALRAARSSRFSEEFILGTAAASTWEDAARALAVTCAGRPSDAATETASGTAQP